MRNLFFALLLANLGFAAWQAWLAPSPPARAEDGGVPPIRLVDEVGGGQSGTGAAAGPEDESSEAGDHPPGAAGGGSAASGGDRDGTDGAGGPADGNSMPVAPDPRCVSVGPFPELSEAATASAKLRAAGYESTQRVGQGDIWVGYWVHIEGIPTRDEANAALATLHENGITEAYRIPGEEDGDLISLGVFTEVSRAGRLRDQVRQLGFEPTVVDRTRRGTVYWVDVRLGRAEDLDFETLQTPGRITRLEQRACDAA